MVTFYKSVINSCLTRPPMGRALYPFMATYVQDITTVDNIAPVSIVYNLVMTGQ